MEGTPTATPKLTIIIPAYNVGCLVETALRSIPHRDDIEVIAYDDGSTDNTLAVISDFARESDINLTIIAGVRNRGTGYAKNRLLEVARGDYFHTLDGDDYLYTDEYSSLVDFLYTTDADVVGFNLIMNNGSVHQLVDANKQIICAQTVRFIRRDFVKGITFPEDGLFGEDWHYNEALLKRNPKTIYTNRNAYHYNHPRIGSLCDQYEKGTLKCSIS